VTVRIDCPPPGWIPGSTHCAVIHVTRTCFAAWACHNEARSSLVVGYGWASTWSYLDITALGRKEEWEDSPEGYPQTPPYKWWNWHDEYAAGDSVDPRWNKVVENAKVTLDLND
jgi:hypothetical protein